MTQGEREMADSMAKAWMCEVVREKEFNLRDPELSPGWVVKERKNGKVYIVYDPEEEQRRKQMTEDQARFGTTPVGEAPPKISFVGFDIYQEEAWKTAIYPHKGNNIYYPALGLAGEVGEACNRIKKVMRDSGGEPDGETLAALKKELGDALWYFAALARELGLGLSGIAHENLLKLQDRQKRGVLQGNGDDR